MTTSEILETYVGLKCWGTFFFFLPLSFLYQIRWHLLDTCLRYLKEGQLCLWFSMCLLTNRQEYNSLGVEGLQQNFQSRRRPCTCGNCPSNSKPIEILGYNSSTNIIEFKVEIGGFPGVRNWRWNSELKLSSPAGVFTGNPLRAGFSQVLEKWTRSPAWN